MRVKLLGGFGDCERWGVYPMGYRVYSVGGLCPALLSDCGGFGLLILAAKR